MLSPYCPSRPVPSQYGQIAEAAGAGGTAHGAITGALVGIANAADAPVSARAVARGFLPLTITLTFVEGYFNGAASAEAGEPLDVAAARAILPGAGAVVGGAIGGGPGTFAGPIGTAAGGLAGGIAGEEAGKSAASEYARSRGCV